MKSQKELLTKENATLHMAVVDKNQQEKNMHSKIQQLEEEVGIV